MGVLSASGNVGGVSGDDCLGEWSGFFGLDEKLLTYAKTLTPSDANNGGGFSVPRYCADFILPKLDFGNDPSVEVLAVRDMNGTVWNFRHIYRGTPRRHLLTTGWSKFVNSKKLVTGDTVIFMRDPASTATVMSVGIGRASKAGGSAQCARWRQMMGGGGSESNCKEGSVDGLFGGSKGKEEEVVRAMEKWMAMEEFEVVYHPTRIGGGVGTAAEFVIAREAVEEAAKTFWGG
ncbi:hypothetical protein MLD38_022442 [Melastoma candidum]|uniref:Uncharacterized protein n=1 Tax=Melastoma candidum TaxID=119954 RepID=A0ACB9QJ65_9MYRT|nr:hypothetical protein MLD38_022442 [Melastoma candidum]